MKYLPGWEEKVFLSLKLLVTRSISCHAQSCDCLGRSLAQNLGRGYCMLPSIKQTNKPGCLVHHGHLDIKGTKEPKTWQNRLVSSEVATHT